MRRLVLSVLVLAGCGRVDFDAYLATAGDAAPSCTLGPFGSAVELAELDEAGNEWGPSVSPDGTELLFASDRMGSGFQTYRATRTALDQPFGAATLVDPGLGGGQSIDDPFQTPDGLALYFDTDPGDVTSGELYVATRGDPAAPFGDPQPLDAINAGAGVQDDPALSDDQLTLIFDSTRDGGDFDLYAATRATTADAFGSTAITPIFQMQGTDCCAVFTAGSRQLVFASQHGLPAARRELFVAPIGAGAALGSAVLLGSALAGIDGDDTDAALTADGKRVVFASTRSTGTSSGNAYDLYEATRDCQ